MLKYIGDLKELEKFGFIEKKDYAEYDRENGTEDFYELDLGGVSYKIVYARHNWLWLGGFADLLIIDMIPNDYDMFPSFNDFDILYTLITLGLVEMVV